jgi:hypothetical protein
MEDEPHIDPSKSSVVIDFPTGVEQFKFYQHKFGRPVRHNTCPPSQC